MNMPGINPDRCPLCGGPNDCQLCSAAAYKGPCWCMREEIPGELLLRVPDDFRHACICLSCVWKFKRERNFVTPHASQRVN